MPNLLPTITIACPIRNRSKFIPSYLKNIYDIDYPRDHIKLLWVVNNSSDDSERLLIDFRQKHTEEYLDISILHFNKNKVVPEYNRKANHKVKIHKDGRQEIVQDDSIQTVYSHLADLRNFIFDKVDTDYLLSVDSDIMVKPNILRKLLEPGEKIVSSLIYNGYLFCPEEPYKYPNIMKKIEDTGNYKHIVNWYVKNAATLSECKIIPVDLTGAICLISKEVCKNTRYAYDKQGEDAFWSADCQSKGYNLYCRLDAFSEHLMDENMLQQYVERNK